MPASCECYTLSRAVYSSGFVSASESSIESESVSPRSEWFMSMQAVTV